MSRAQRVSGAGLGGWRWAGRHWRRHGMAHAAVFVAMAWVALWAGLGGWRGGLPAQRSAVPAPQQLLQR